MRYLSRLESHFPAVQIVVDVPLVKVHGNNRFLRLKSLTWHIGNRESAIEERL